MQRSSVLRRYLPLAVVLAVQLLIIAVLAPSKAPGTTVAAGASEDFESPYATGGADGATTRSTVVNEQGQVVDAETGEVIPNPGAPAPGQGPGGQGPGGTDTGGEAAAGDTGHCVDGRQFDPALDFYAPPCVPAWSGDNGGATYQGVTGDTIKIVQYYGRGNDAVDAILRVQNAYISADNYRQYHEVIERFINENYELYGRRVDFELFEGSCSTIPPDNQCLRDEMRRLVQDEQPYFVLWLTSLSSESFDELSRLQTPNAGGWHFRDSFSQARAPYHWDLMMSGTRLAQHVGAWWCRQMEGRPTQFAGDRNNLENLNGRPRVLGVISTNDPENQASVEVDLAAALAECGAGYGQKTYFYAQDITTADQQRRAAVLRMRQAPGHNGASGPATSIVCMCDLVAPAFLFAEEQTQNYWPENIVPGTGLMDGDVAAQAYMGTLGCPFGRPCNYEDAFGISSIGPQEPENQDVGSRVWQAGGGSGNTPMASASASTAWEYYNMIATLLQGAGPNLTPANMEAGAFATPARGDATHPMRSFFPGNYGWITDMRVVYWSPDTPAAYNGEPGAYIDLYDRRFALEDWGDAPAELQLPAKPR
jgi:hypothetical protein